MQALCSTSHPWISQGLFGLQPKITCDNTIQPPHVQMKSSTWGYPLDYCLRKGKPFWNTGREHRQNKRRQQKEKLFTSLEIAWITLNKRFLCQVNTQTHLQDAPDQRNYPHCSLAALVTQAKTIITAEVAEVKRWKSHSKPAKSINTSLEQPQTPSYIHTA